MLEKILTDGFKRTLRTLFTDIQNQLDLRDEQEFAHDEERIRDELLDVIEPYPSGRKLDEDYRIAAVDGSGTDSLMQLDDVRIHLFSTATVVVNTSTSDGKPFEPITSEIEQELGDQPKLDPHWHSRIRGDARKKMGEKLEDIYPGKYMSTLVLPFFRDYEKDESINSVSDLKGTKYTKYLPALKNMHTLISGERGLSNSIVHDELRKSSEYAAARHVLTSDISPKFLLLDGALYVYTHPKKRFPFMPSGFMLRELCELARHNGVILGAVSKHHTIPFAHRIAMIAKEEHGINAKWFCRLPSEEDPGGGLHIYTDRTYIPPRLGVPYLYRFSAENRPSRIDFDRKWWLHNIFVKDDPDATRKNEKELFREIEFMSRDARWYGYPVPLALAHEKCTLRYEDVKLAQEVCREVRHEMELGSEKTSPMRDDYNL
ncbi:MAG: hypothetical protein ACOC38_03430 [Promethearchaeia archaeon]